ncbi:MAG TPA: DUF3995 domain-containing protein [Geodermatophilus sp.]|nr:DUF3995 domain-containing protein [Geodermatophilus sp.]
MTDRSRLPAWSAYGAAVLATLSAAVSAYWLTGGTWLLSTVGGVVEEEGRQGGAAVTAGLALVVLGKLAVAVLVLALAHPPAGHRLQRVVGTTAMLTGGVLTLYGGALVAVGAVALTGVLGEPADPTALRWHVLLWDPWFLLWGVLLLVAARTRRRLAPRRTPAG